MQINQTIIKQDECFPTDDLGNSWDTAEEWFQYAVNEDYADGEYTEGEWKALCRSFASEARYMMELIISGN